MLKTALVLACLTIPSLVSATPLDYVIDFDCVRGCQTVPNPLLSTADRVRPYRDYFTFDAETGDFAGFVVLWMDVPFDFGALIERDHASDAHDILEALRADGGRWEGVSPASWYPWFIIQAGQYHLRVDNDRVAAPECGLVNPTGCDAYGDFTVRRVSEPATLGLVLLGAAAVIRRKR